MADDNRESTANDQASRLAMSIDDHITAYRPRGWHIVGNACDRQNITPAEAAYFLNSVQEAKMIYVESDDAKKFLRERLNSYRAKGSDQLRFDSRVRTAIVDYFFPKEE